MVLTARAPSCSVISSNRFFFSSAGGGGRRSGSLRVGGVGGTEGEAEEEREDLTSLPGRSRCFECL